MSEEKPKQLFWYRAKLLGLILVFLSPFLIGWMAMYVFEIRPTSINYGELVVPAQKLDWPELEAADGDRYETGFGRKWVMLMFVADGCSEQCRSNLYYMRQIRVLLGRDTPRLQNVLVSTGSLDAEMRAFLADYPDLAVVENNRNEDLYGQFRLPGHGEPGAQPKLYLIDPEDNLMMHYPAQIDENRVLDDLRKLMKLSQIG